MLEKAFSKDAKLKPRFIDNTKIFKRVMKMLKMIFPQKLKRKMKERVLWSTSEIKKSLNELKVIYQIVYFTDVLHTGKVAGISVLYFIGITFTRTISMLMNT